MGKKPDDGIVIWKENETSFLPKKIAKDRLATFLKLLIGKVKEDHARNGYNKDVKDYALQITQIMDVAVKNGYRLHDYSEENTEDHNSANNNAEDDGIDWDSIVD